MNEGRRPYKNFIFTTESTEKNLYFKRVIFYSLCVLGELCGEYWFLQSRQSRGCNGSASNDQNNGPKRFLGGNGMRVWDW